MEGKKIFPNFWQALLFNCIIPMVVLAIVIVTIVFLKIVDINKLYTFNSYFGHILTIPILLFFLWKSKIKVRWAEFTKLNIKNILIVIALTIIIDFVFRGTISLFDYLFNLNYPASSSNTYYLAIIHSLVLAPIIEELLYRRVFLHQFLKHYPVWVAVTLSAVLFTMPHVPVILHFELFVPFFISGIFLGLVYYKTNSISYCIIGHFIMNLLTYAPFDKIF